jgi:hypothetical protein
MSPIEDLVDDMAAETGLEQTCAICDETFSTDRGFKFHMKNSHPDDPMVQDDPRL